MAETKLRPFDIVNEVTPAQIQTLANASWKCFMLGDKPAGWPTDALGCTALNGFNIPVGTAHNQRLGKKVFLRKATFSLNIDINQLTSQGGPFTFRVIIAKPRKAGSPAAVAYVPQTSLFLAPSGFPFGHSTDNITGLDLMVQPTCRKHWYVKHDRRFILSHPQAVTNQNSAIMNGFSSKYHTQKSLRFSIPINKQVGFEIAGSDVPSDINVGWGVYVFCRGQGQDASTTNKWEVNLRGCVSFIDM